MKTLLKKIFLNNWPRKLISFVLAIIIWLLVTHSMTSNKILHKIPIKVINIPAGKTIEGMEDDNYLSQTVNLTLTGNRNILEEISEADIEIIIDGKDIKSGEKVVITPKNLVCTNPEIDLQKNISKLNYIPFSIKFSNITTQRIPIIITQPIGEPPKGYLYLDIWPYQLYVTVKGPQEAVKTLKNKGLKLTYNLSDISQQDLASHSLKEGDTICFLIPDSWKKISLPSISSTPLIIDDPQAKALRIDFAKNELLPIETPIPVNIFFPPKTSTTLNPDTCILGINDFIQKKNGIKMITQPLYAYGVSKVFLDIVKNMVEIVIIATTHNSKESPLWNPEFVYPHELEDRYVAKIMLETADADLDTFRPQLREEYLRNRFRSYMNKFRLYTSEKKKLSLDVRLDGNTIQISPR